MQIAPTPDLQIAPTHDLQIAPTHDLQITPFPILRLFKEFAEAFGFLAEAR
jgi:hypothetical protein